MLLMPIIRTAGDNFTIAQRRLAHFGSSSLPCGISRKLAPPATATYRREMRASAHGMHLHTGQSVRSRIADASDRAIVGSFIAPDLPYRQQSSTRPRCRLPYQSSLVTDIEYYPYKSINYAVSNVLLLLTSALTSVPALPWYLEMLYTTPVNRVMAGHYSPQRQNSDTASSIFNKSSQILFAGISAFVAVWYGVFGGKVSISVSYNI